MTRYPENEYRPRSGDGSLPAEDDSLLRQPSDDVLDDPDLEQAESPGEQSPDDVDNVDE